MPLHLKLRRGERLVVNGAVLEMGARRGEILIHNQTDCLREADLLRPDEVSTPARRVHFEVQMMIVDPAARAHHTARFHALVGQLEQALGSEAMRDRLDLVRREVACGRPYRALALLRAIRRYEDVLLSAARLRAAEVAEVAAYDRLLGKPQPGESADAIA
jgi:flagellar protein FlbT